MYKITRKKAIINGIIVTFIMAICFAGLFSNLLFEVFQKNLPDITHIYVFFWILPLFVIMFATVIALYILFLAFENKK